MSVPVAYKVQSQLAHLIDFALLPSPIWAEAEP